MKTVFVDTNIFLRFLTRDQEKQFQACRRLFVRAKQGKIKLTTSALVVFELIWTITSYYQESKESVIEKMMSILDFPNLAIEHEELFLESLLLWQQQNTEFNDAFNYMLAKRKKIRDIYSFDKHFDTFPQVTRQEP